MNRTSQQKPKPPTFQQKVFAEIKALHIRVSALEEIATAPKASRVREPVPCYCEQIANGSAQYKDWQSKMVVELWPTTHQLHNSTPRADFAAFIGECIRLVSMRSLTNKTDQNEALTREYVEKELPEREPKSGIHACYEWAQREFPNVADYKRRMVGLAYWAAVKQSVPREAAAQVMRSKAFTKIVNAFDDAHESQKRRLFDQLYMLVMHATDGGREL